MPTEESRHGPGDSPSRAGPGAAEPFRVGVNYWPRRKAMGWWKAFDRGEVEEELDVVAGLGLSLVRIFLLWEDFQPSPDVVAVSALADLETVAGVAADRGLGLDVTFFTGHMSGPNWAPGWLLDGDEPVPGGRQVVSAGRTVQGGYRNPFVDPVALGAQEMLVRRVLERLHDHPGIWAWNLGNEPDLFALPPDDQAGPGWAARLIGAIRERDDRHLVTVGLHVPDLEADLGLRADRMFRDCDISVMHAYPVYSTWARGPLDADMVPFVSALTAALSGRPVVAEEFGAPTAPPGEPTQTWRWDVEGRPREQVMLSEEDLASHLGEVLPNLVAAGAHGALLWCFADYDPSLWDEPPCDRQRHERHFGLVRPDGSLKPHAGLVRDFCAGGPTVQAPAPHARIEIDGDDFYADPMARIPVLYERFRAR
jgi:endo-1,4-beta-mannosidase